MQPTVLAMAGLMLLLLPLALLCTSLEKRAGIALALTGGDAPVSVAMGPVEKLRIIRTTDGFEVVATVRTTDVRAHAGDVQERTLHATDARSLADVMARMKRLDSTLTRATLVPLPRSTTAEVVRWMDVLRGGPDAPLFPDIELETQP
jgi:hypothetical protein